jgi:polysaccharide export outer membrane protein
MRFFQLVLLGAFTAFAVAGTDSGQPATFSEHDPRYQLQPTDVVEIHYRYTPEFDQTVTIQPDGFAELQIVGDLKLQGLTLAQAKQAILEKASARLQDPELTLILKEFEKPYFVVGGEVGTPGRFEMRGTVTAVEAIAMAGGFKNTSKHSQVVLFRKISPDLARTQILDLKSAMNGSATEANITLRPGDMLIVPQNRISKIERIVKLANIGTFIPF